jgi:hypothetical protein
MSIFEHIRVDAAGIAIKNTFVHIADEQAGSKRRSSSAPPHFHNIEKLEPRLDDEECQPNCKLNDFFMVSDRRQGSKCSDDCTASTTDNSDAADASDADSSEEPSPTASVDLSAAKQSPAYTRTPLRRNSKVWSPCQASTALAATTAPLGGVPLDIRHRLSRTILHAKQMIGALSLIYRTALMESTGVWSLVGYCNPEHRNYAQILLSKAKQALVSAADNSSDVFAIGYDATPVIGSQCQICVNMQFALVEDKSKACWDILTKGFCPRGHACRWQHPLWKAPVSIGISFEQRQ